MSWDSSFWWPHTVRIQSIGGGGLGPAPGATRSSVAEVKDERRLVRTTDGDQVVSSSTVTVPLAANVREGELVTVWLGTTAERTARVLAVGRDENDPPLPSHLVLSLE
ncbi:hypothetical protein HF576_01895 [Microbacterium sp. CFH 90308]|uniref:Uncharacterized protein n=1 Tax=Microbacterium salsuginis TaxID=2722803 RepID=A0ABX1K6E9_9MICO|nr:hypothetical protein [Microbacterium sp. CFH 90308]NLP82591.1 hypothetical protein [Microbacterium sp. CFH 90308]